MMMKKQTIHIFLAKVETKTTSTYNKQFRSARARTRTGALYVFASIWWWQKAAGVNMLLQEHFSIE